MQINIDMSDSLECNENPDSKDCIDHKLCLQFEGCIAKMAIQEELSEKEREQFLVENEQYIDECF